MTLISSAATKKNAAPLLLCATLALAGTLLPSTTALAQSAPQQNQYSGVSQPPADDVINADEDAQQAQHPVAAKPSPGTPAQAAPPAQAAYQQQPSAMTVGSSAPAGQNPDYGIVTQVPQTEAPAPVAQHSDPNGVRLVSRPRDPDDGIVNVVPSPNGQLAEGTNLRVRLLTPLSTLETQDGQPFRAQVVRDVYKDGRVVIPVGSEMRGRVVQVTHGHRIGAHSTIRLRPDAVVLPDGTAYHLYAQAIASEAPGTHIDSEGGIQARTHYVKDAAEYGVGAGGGAVVGAALGGPVGAGAGALVGAGVVTTHMLLQKPAPTSLQTGSEIVFSLTEAMDLLPTRN